MTGNGASGTLAVMRIVAAMLLLAKAVPTLVGGAHGFGLALMMALLVVGVLVALGLATRVAAGAALLLLVAIYAMFHAPHGLSPIDNGGVPAILSAVIFLHFAVAGGGPWSLDARLNRSH